MTSKPDKPSRGGGRGRPAPGPGRRRRGGPTGAAKAVGQKAATHWDAVAEWYDELVGDEGSEYQREVVFPGVLRLLKVRAGMRVLDVACGQGVLCRVLHEKGAEVVGVDAAGKLLSAARQRGPGEIRYLQGDARELGANRGLEAGWFDAAACVLAIQNIHPMAGVFEGAAWALKEGGALVVVMMHPAFRSPKATSWGWEGNAVQYRRVDRYLLPRREPIVSHPGRKDGGYTWTFHRPLQDYVKALSRSGLLVAGLEEWSSHKVSQPGPRAKAENTARAEIPMFAAIRAVKVRR